VEGGYADDGGGVNNVVGVDGVLDSGSDCNERGEFPAELLSCRCCSFSQYRSNWSA